MSVDLSTLAAIFAMAIVTYATRLAGPLIAGRLELRGRTLAAVEAIPGSVLIAVIAPLIANSGVAGVLAGAITALAALRGSLVFAVLVGVGSAALFRHLF